MQERSQNSPHNNAWKAPPPWTDHLPWNLINHLTLPFNKILMGDEVYTLSIKSDEGLCCDHCNDGGTNSYLDYYDGHVLRECSHCHNRSLKALKSYR
jgi:hypothetical protein